MRVSPLHPMSLPILVVFFGAISLVSHVLFPVDDAALFQRPDRPRARTPGSYNGLSAWHRQRAYPHHTLPKQGLAQGFQQAGQHMAKAEAHYKDSDPWTPVPAVISGRTLALAFHPTRPGTLFAGSASGGLWRTDQATTEPHWERVPTGFPIHGVAAIAIHPDNPDLMLIGTGEVYGFEETFPSYARRETRGSYGIGILKSEDGGRTWSMSLDWRNRQDSGMQDLAFDPHDPDRVWAATSEGVYRSPDRGKTWTQVQAVPMATSLVLFPNRPGRVLVACGGFASPGHGLYLSEDHGATWHKRQGGLPELFGGKAMLHASQSHPDTVYATIGNGHIVCKNKNGQPSKLDRPCDNATWLCRSEDGGRTWTQVNDKDFSQYQGWYCHFPYVNPRNPDHVFLGGLHLNFTVNGGFTIFERDPLIWENGYLGDMHAMAFSPHHPDLAYLAGDQGMAVSKDGGLNWIPANQGYHTVQYYNGMAVSSYAPNTVIGTAQDIVGVLALLRDDDGQPVMNQFFFGHEAGYVVVDPRQPDYIRASGPYLTFLESIDGSSSPIPLCTAVQPGCGIETHDQTATFNAPVLMAPSNPDVLYAGRNVVWRSDDGGQTWKAGNDGVPLGADPVLAMAVSPTDEDVVYVATAPNHDRLHLFKTTDGGNTWTEITGDLPDRYVPDLAIDPRDDRILYAAVSGFGSDHLYRTRDGGTTWESLDRGNLPDLPTTAIAIDPEHPQHLYLGNDLGVFVSLDGGHAWSTLMDGLPEAILVGDLVIDPATRTLNLGSHGNGLYTRSLLDPLPGGVGAVLPFSAVLPDIREGGDAHTLIGILHPGGANPIEIADVRISGFTGSGGSLGQSEALTHLEPGQSVLVPVAELFPELPSAVHWLRVESDSELIVFAELSDRETRSAYLANPATTTTYLPHVARDTAQFRTDLIAVNPATGEVDVEVQAFPAGASARPIGLGLGLTRASSDVARLFDGDLSDISWARLSGTTPLAAMARFTRLPGHRETAALGLHGVRGTELNLLHVAADTGQFWTGLVYINTGNDRAEVVEESFDAAGNLIGSHTLAVTPHAKQTLLFDGETVRSGDPRIRAGTAWMRIRANQPLIGYELLGAPTSSGNELFAGLQGNTAAAARLIYPFLRSDPTQWTGLVAVNTDDRAVEAEAVLYNRAGETVARNPLGTVQAGQKITRLVRDLFPGAPIDGGHVEIEATRPVLAGFQLWGDDGADHRRFLAGISAIGR
ncbi:Sortilin-Vps10 domain-containing protein [Sulfidibacter corallicola]|uniref:Sortilin N-terminal domain-containing protein n=1 Tax=Sulfidibacter corallicola TaxID=2818388 RepID=A0A8A4TH33_SULCO|nr:sialidase family protein [Sulfidibacter corallicola]QTD48827.1 hypothetical protein J3U87_24865 [Sulfidibacter corallicola]